jgi:hypothetical protein
MLALAVFVGVWIERSHERQVQVWAKDHGYTVVSIEYVWLSNDSPFWRRKGDDLRRVRLRNEYGERTSFFRWTAWWGMEQAWKEEEKN